MATKEMCDDAYQYGLVRIKKMAGVEVGEDWPAFSVQMWIKDLNQGYYYEFAEAGKLVKSEIVHDQPVNATATVFLISDDYLGQIAQEVSLMEKYFSGEISIKGDVVAMQRFSAFAPYEPYYPKGHPKHKD